MEHNGQSIEVLGDPNVGRSVPADGREAQMLAAINMGIIGTIIVVAVVIALVLFFLRRA